MFPHGAPSLSLSTEMQLFLKQTQDSIVLALGWARPPRKRL